MGQYVAGHIVKSLVVHLFDRYDVRLLGAGIPGLTDYETDRNSWTPKADVLLELVKREGSAI